MKIISSNEVKAIIRNVDGEQKKFQKHDKRKNVSKKKTKQE